MAHAKNHDYHILNPSIWPFLGAVGAFVMLFGAVLWMHAVTPWLFWIGFVGVLYVMFAWWAEVVTESHVGDHTPVVRIGLRYGFILFIMSEVMFFSAWFWSFFKHAMYPMSEYFGTEYVQPEIYHVDAFHLPLINTLILLLSGCAVTWAHHALVHGGQPDALILCHEPTRTHMRGLPEYQQPSLATLRDTALPLARVGNPACEVVGISVNTQHMSEEDAKAYLAEVEAEMGLPTTDPYRFGSGKLGDALQAM